MNPKAGLYLRQLPVEGVHTKFFERYQTILDELLLHAQPEEVNTSDKRFEARHGLRWEQPLVRWRFLDYALQITRGFPTPDLAIPAPAFRALKLGGVTAIITENLRNFLALPALPNTVAIFGSGDAAALLRETGWLDQARILYWGDMDPRGYAILARLREQYPHTQSVLMDLETLVAYRNYAVKAEPVLLALPALTRAEQGTLAHLCTEGLWLEQERIPFAEVIRTFTCLLRPQAAAAS